MQVNIYPMITEKDKALNKQLIERIDSLITKHRFVFGNPDDIAVRELFAKLKNTKVISEQNSIMTRIIYFLNQTHGRNISRI